MNEMKTNSDKVIKILEMLSTNEKMSSVTRDLAKYILEDTDINKEVNRPVALLNICSNIFINCPDALIEMNRVVFEMVTVIPISKVKLEDENKGDA